MKKIKIKIINEKENERRKHETEKEITKKEKSIDECSKEKHEKKTCSKCKEGVKREEREKDAGSKKMEESYERGDE